MKVVVLLETLFKQILHMMITKLTHLGTIGFIVVNKLALEIEIVVPMTLYLIILNA